MHSCHLLSCNYYTIARRLFKYNVAEGTKGHRDAHGKLLRSGMIGKMFGQYPYCSMMGLKKGNICKDILPVLCENKKINEYNGSLFVRNPISPYSHWYHHFLSTLQTYSGIGISTKAGEVSAINTAPRPSTNDYYQHVEHNRCSVIGDSFNQFIKPKDT